MSYGKVTSTRTNRSLETPASSPTSPRHRRRLAPPPTRGRPLRRLGSPPVLRRELVEPERVSRHRPRRRRRERLRRPRPPRLAQTRRDENRALSRGAPHLPRRLPRARHRLGLTLRHHLLGAPLHLLVSPPSTVRDPRGDESETRALPRPSRVRRAPPARIASRMKHKGTHFGAPRAYITDKK